MTTSREELLHAVTALGEKHPHWRLGQLVCNVAGWADLDVWDVEDNQLLTAIRQQQEYQTSLVEHVALNPKIS